MTTLGILLMVFGGALKALRDRDLWGSFADDGVLLFYERWAWYQKWRDTDARLLWIPVDAWHCFDMGSIYCTLFAFASYIDAGLGLVIILTVFTVCYHGLLLANPLDGIRDWLKRYVGN